MKITTKIQTKEITMEYADGRVFITVSAPSIKSESILTDNMISELINKIKKSGTLIIDGSILTRWETAGILAALQLMKRDKHYCYLCDTNKHGMYDYKDWNVMIHSRRLPRK